MADNYLEKKMDDYRRGVNKSRPTPAVSRPKPGYMAVSMQDSSVLVVASDISPKVEATVKKLCRYGCKVNLCGSGNLGGLRQLAWDSGCTFNPASPEKAYKDAKIQRGKIDAIVVFGCFPELVTAGSKLIAVDCQYDSAFSVVSGIVDEDVVASAVVFLTQALKLGIALAITGLPQKY